MVEYENAISRNPHGNIMDFQRDIKGKSPLRMTPAGQESDSHKLTTGPAMRSKTLPPPPEWSIAQALGLEKVAVSWLAGDGSDRCYYRIQTSKGSYVLMQLSGDDALQLQKDGYEWVKIGKLLHDHGIFAPQTVAQLPEFAALIIEDYGDIMMETHALEALKHGERKRTMDFYRQSFGILNAFLKITDAGSSKWKERSFDAARFDWELHFFQEQFLQAVLGWTLSAAEQKTFDSETAKLAEFLAKSSQYFVHRDFHSRNVMVKSGRLAVIDFQDARLGPATYDLVSLCFDSYIPLKKDERRQLVKEGIDSMVQALPGLPRAQLEAQWGPMLLQRQIKALGSFGYLTVQKNRGNYLKYVEPALETLDAENVGHKDWPFLSGELITQIRERWKTRKVGRDL
jgi:aminoglycoside/choline kinase family phosphotransferase